MSKKEDLVIIAIVAHGRNFEIGKENKLLWKVASDLSRFKKLTLGHTVVMGRKTFESIRRPLPERTNIIMTRNADWPSPPSTLCCRNREEVLQWVKKHNVKTLFILGGEEIYREWWELIDQLYVTVIDYSGQADAFFPSYSLQDWKLIQEEHLEASDKDQFDSHFMILQKVSKSPK